MAVTMADVARRAGTSVAVVSYVLNNGPRPVAEATRARVLAAAAELGYRRNRVAAALRSGSTGLVGLVLPDTVNPYFAALGRQIEQALADAGKLTVIANSGYDSARQSAAVDGFLAARVDGLIIVWTGDSTDPAAETPVVYVHNRPPGSTATVIAGDNRAGVAEAVAHLREHGHERIDFLAGETDDGPVGERVAAWRAAAQGRLLRSAYSRAAAAELMRGLTKWPAALLVATDEQAIGVLSAADAAGVAVPGDLAVVSCDGSPDSEFTVPPLTVVAQPFAEMAQQAVRLLLAEPRDGSPIAVRLTVRRSCGCPHRTTVA
ncbi:LacI family DNA-binding transcriptional regulator [Allokutzneria albata]|uniref:Transcriptional regulator, LacI family n=1 Tax=Allokutzneria albata TaxID=211114 RepID=A0A1G9VN78_ALLAB|nr:LacI family DNA-binding transcriptional regulator [Allokutzneria albata]SDM73692.1 transcriptional regulator, LacI family [Allokutzneria albata]